MFYLNVDRDCYNQLNMLLPDIKPDIKIELLSEDENLEKLGFCKSAPCLVGIDLSEDDLDQLLDDLMQIEVDAFSTPDGRYPQDNDPFYRRYCKYGWMWDVLYHAEANLGSLDK